MSHLDTPPSADSQVDLRKYFDLLLGQKRFILAFCIAAMFSALALTYVFSERYRAATTILYRPLEKSVLRAKEAEAFGMPVPIPSFQSISQTLNDTVKNEVILRPVIKELKLDQDIPAGSSVWYKRWYYKSKEFVKQRALDVWSILKYGRILKENKTVATIKGLRENIQIMSTSDSNITILMVKDKYPKRAAAIVNTAGETLVRWIRNEYRSEAHGRLEQLEEELLKREKEIASLREESKALLEEHGFVSLQEDTDRGLENLYEMEMENTGVKAQIIQKQKEIAEYRRGIEGRSRGYVQSEDIDRMRSAKLFEEINLKGLKKKNDYLEASIHELREQLKDLPLLKSRLDALNLKIESSSQDYKHLKDLRLEAFEQVNSEQVEARVLHEAVVPVMPIQPIRIYHVGLAAVLSFLLAVGLVFVMDFFHIRTFLSPGNDGQEPSGVAGFKSLHPLIRYPLVAFGGLVLGAAVYYVLRKLGY